MTPRITRRTFSLLAVGGVLSACGSTGSSTTETSTEQPDPVAPDTAPGPVGIQVPDREPAGSVPNGIGDGISAFGYDVFARLVESVGSAENVSFSPLSVAIALAMVEPGSVGVAQSELRDLLRITDPVMFHAGMNALEQSLEARQPTGLNSEEGDPGELIIRIANAAYLQQGFPFTDTYLDTVGRNYGPVLNEVDFSSDPDAVAVEINGFVAEATHDRITDLLQPGSINPATVLALVNALFMRASWESVFPSEGTADASFTSADGSLTDIAMMHGRSTSSAKGDGWVGASKSYVGDLTAQFILPDDGRFEEVAARLGDTFAELSRSSGNGADFAMPRFETRLNVTLDDALMAAGLTAPYRPGGLTGIADDPRLAIDAVVHETFVAFDEEGTEAAAATVVLILVTSAPVDEPIPVTLDRPFFYRLADRVTGTTLFLGQVTDPTT